MELGIGALIALVVIVVLLYWLMARAAAVCGRVPRRCVSMTSWPPTALCCSRSTLPTTPHSTRKVASWVLLGMGRLARQLPGLPSHDTRAPRALLLADEVGALDSAARHLRGLVGRARESGLAVVLATQGSSDLEAVDRSLLPQVLQDTPWQLAFRQGSPQDAERMQALFGLAYVEDLTRYSDGRRSTRQVDRPRVRIDEFMNDLQPGDAWLRVAPIDRGWRQERVRVALPRAVLDQLVYIPAVSRQPRLATRNPDNDVVVPADPPGPSRAPSGHGCLDLAGAGGLDNRPINPEPVVELTVEQRFLQDQEAAAAFWARVKKHGMHRRYWTGPTDRKGYGRVRWKGLELKAHRVVWTAEVGPLPDPDKWTLDHRCPEQRDKACCTPEHERLVPRDNNTRQRWQDERDAAAPESAGTFAIALFAGVDKTAVEQRTVSLNELRQMLSKFEILADKRRGRCWSPTRYAAGASSRGNAGVVEVSALVFDMDKVPPDPERLAGVYWLGHTTYQHTPQAPRWRVVIPLSAPVPAAQWSDVWHCARAALCPRPTRPARIPVDSITCPVIAAA